MHGPVDSKLYLQPLGFLRGCRASGAVKDGHAWWLAGGQQGIGLAFTLVRILFRHEGMAVDEVTLPVGHIGDYQADLSSFHQGEMDRLLGQIQGVRPPLPCGEGRTIAWDKPVIQGIVNVTPDSFSDGGRYDQAEKAVDHALALMAAGADIIDIGGESTRPGAEKVSIEEELSRVIPVIDMLAARSVPISIDSRNARVMKAALGAGAAIVNDVSALGHDGDALKLVAQQNCPVILMHAQKTPDVMQDNPQYDDVLLDVYDYLEQRLEVCLAAGIDRANLLVDPGIGFGKALEHNLALLSNLSFFHGLGVPVLLGVSRKSFLGALSHEPEASQRLAGSLASGVAGWEQGVQILRVHDVRETRQARDVWQRLTL
ncbi:dihydropteroate synthase [Paremcibacter congregatus]|uniref:Dihydropteroate synthase n=1 Tax=Paremcibacter congregatus TaxID=2043170 RepID=A0A2G4YTV5_9PROT|nr:dihydropteroate synthase [Paremcibacter congregatus]PHZ85758.1 dihydropteroate synthase [Paremcibacter congregatus]QDE26719.1 dihydropteroate synthase [Paremcibacter congregatus]